MYKLVYFIPLNDNEKVKQALFKIGAGRQGHYDQCCFEVEGRGQFRPLENSQPHLGQQGQLEYVQELRVELLVKKEIISEVVKELIKIHPYEEVAYEVYKIERDF